MQKKRYRLFIHADESHHWEEQAVNFIHQNSLTVNHYKVGQVYSCELNLNIQYINLFRAIRGTMKGP